MKKIKQVVPENLLIDIENLFKKKKQQFSLSVFDTLIVDFSNHVSKAIIKNKLINRIPAYVALAYWLRKSNIDRIISENKNYSQNKNISLSPLGIVFHVCPSNVDTMFIYSLFVSLIAGNKNILRISSRNEDQNLLTLLSIFNAILNQEFHVLKDYITVVRYERNDNINKYISSKVDGRIIWGGDETIKSFKQLVDNPRSKDLVFADRQSFSLIKTAVFNNLDQNGKKNLVHKFFNDSYSFDQKGCSSPQIIITWGNPEHYEKFKKEFYIILENIVSKNYVYDPASLASLKMNQLANDAIDGAISSYYGPNKNLVFAEMATKTLNNHSCGGGYFYTKNIEEVNDLFFITSKKIQTLAYFGLSESDKKAILKISNGKGLERIVPVGEALNFDYIWDGYNLIDELTTKKVTH